jgi:hypothetical protein
MVQAVKSVAMPITSAGSAFALAKASDTADSAST